MRPKGLPRQAAREMVALVRHLLNCSYAIVAFSDEEQVAFGRVSQSHEEGYSAREVLVRLTDAAGVYDAEMTDHGRDCDGRHSSGSNLVYRRRGKAERFYLSRNFQNGRPCGRFYVRRWRGFEQGEQPHVYDQFAQAAGY